MVETVSGSLGENNSPKVFWITGLSAAGKTSLARALSDAMENLQYQVTVLDGDELRQGLCADLGLTEEDRAENIRRAGEVARLMYQAGLSVVCAFISPFQDGRDRVRALFPPGDFHEIYLSTPIEVCAARDPKGLYRSARDGLINGISGWDSPYEPPESPEFQFDTGEWTVDQIVEEVMARTVLAECAG